MFRVCRPQNVAKDVDEATSERGLHRRLEKGDEAAAQTLVASNEVRLVSLKLGPRGYRALGAALARSECRAETLVLHRSLIICGDKLQGLATGLARNSTVRVLDLAHNYIEDYAMSKLAHAIATNTTLEIINVQANRIGSNGAGQGYRDLASALEDHASVVELRVGGNSRDGLADFVRRLARARSLKALYLCDPQGNCSNCQNIGHAARKACRDLAAERPDLMVVYFDKLSEMDKPERIFLNEPIVHWERTLDVPNHNNAQVATSADADRIVSACVVGLSR